MDEAESITMRLEAYWIQLSEVHRRWTEWLTQSERSVLQKDIGQLEGLEPGAQRLMADLEEILSARAQLLEDAADVGLPASSLQSLARSLPAWTRPNFRNALRTAQRQMEHLRRQHAAAWVLMHQSAQFYRGTMMVLTAGRSHQHVYVHSDTSDTSGGQLLDTNL